MAKEKKKTPPARKHSKPAARPARTKASAATDARIRKFAVDSARLLNDLHCVDVLLLDVRKVNDVTDYILIATGTSDRQIRSVGQSVQELGEKVGMKRYGREVDDRATWFVIDLVDVVVHLFDPTTRAHYDIEMLWGDAPRIRWRRTPAAAKSAE
ncbi:MAG: ribosome silencing factor [Planctomycetes bacterium]|nr:ribosome silencing factor [Planctomycetota bacterium]